MSYCVNCGVELHSRLDACPLCNTPVINTNQLQEAVVTAPPFPRDFGQVEMVKRQDLAILTSVVLIATSLCCLLLNWLVFPGKAWSFFIIGACLLLFVFVLPFIIYRHLPVFLSLALDGAAIALYLYMITFNTESNEWFTGLALPITVLATILMEIFALLLNLFPVSFLTVALYFFAEVGLFCVSLELLINHYMGIPLKLMWSAIILTVCTVIVILLATILSKRRLREAVRRGLHF